MAKGRRRQKAAAEKKARKATRMAEGGGKSNYARKRAYLHRHGLWGFQVLEPKPWKRKRTVAAKLAA